MKVARFLTCVLACLLFAGCGPEPRKESPKPERTVTDDLGRTVSIPNEITRVVSLAPSLTEMVYTVGAGDRLVGVTTFCDYPPEAKQIAKIGDTMNPNVETIIGLKPDIVLVSTASQIENFARVLEQNGIAVYVTNPTSLEGVFKNLENLGEMFGTERTSMRFVAHARARVGSVSPGPGLVVREPPVRVFVQISKEPLFTIGDESFVTELIAKAGGVSVTNDIATAYPKLNPEAAAAYDPDVIILSESEDNREPNAAFKNSKAVKNQRVHRISADLLSRPGPRLVDALELLAVMLHPERK
jgi:iron complex transport system substrate-binding protein